MFETKKQKKFHLSKALVNFGIGIVILKYIYNNNIDDERFDLI